MFDTVICASYRRLDASIGASERHDLAVRQQTALVSRAARVHRIPPHVDDVANAPLKGRDNNGYRSDLGRLASEISEIQKPAQVPPIRICRSVGLKGEPVLILRSAPLRASRRMAARSASWFETRKDALLTMRVDIKPSYPASPLPNLLWPEPGRSECNNTHRWLSVPAFAGTTPVITSGVGSKTSLRGGQRVAMTVNPCSPAPG